MKIVYLILILNVLFFSSCGREARELIVLQEGQKYDFPDTARFLAGVSYVPDRNFGGVIVLFENAIANTSVSIRYTDDFLWSRVTLVHVSGDLVTIEISEIKHWIVDVIRTKNGQKMFYSLQMEEIRINEEQFIESIGLDQINELNKNYKKSGNLEKKWRLKFQAEDIPYVELLVDDTKEDMMTMHLIRFSSDDNETEKSPVASISIFYKNNGIRVMSTIRDGEGNIYNYFDVNGDGMPDFKVKKNDKTGKIDYFNIKIIYN